MKGTSTRVGIWGEFLDSPCKRTECECFGVNNNIIMYQKHIN